MSEISHVIHIRSTATYALVIRGPCSRPNSNHPLRSIFVTPDTTVSVRYWFLYDILFVNILAPDFLHTFEH